MDQPGKVANPAHGQLNREKNRLTRDGTAELVLRDQILRQERGQENIDEILIPPV